MMRMLLTNRQTNCFGSGGMTRAYKLADLLSQHMQVRDVKDIRLANRVKEAFKRPIVSPSSIRNWRYGTAQTVRDWRQLLAVANVLSLTHTEADELLEAARLPTVQELWNCADQNDKAFFNQWMTEKESAKFTDFSPDLDLVLDKSLSSQTEVLSTPIYRKKNKTNSKLLPVGSYLPLRPFPLYTGRSKEIDWLAKTLLGNGASTSSSPVTITGIGGIGKTQLAVEFAYLYGHYFPGGVFLLNFDQPNAIEEQIALCGSLLGLNLRSDYDTLPLEKQCRLVQRAWQESTPRLLIFDSCDEDMLKNWQPTRGECHIIVTSRREIWDPALAVKTLSLQMLLREDSISLLRKFLADLSYDEANNIADILGDHPLALRLAGHFLHCYQADVTPGDYLQQLANISKSQESQLLAHSSLTGRSLSRHKIPIDATMNLRQTFSLSYEKLNPDLVIDALAREILMYIACLAPNEPIPRKLIGIIVETASSQNGELEEEPDALLVADALGHLLALGLIQCNLQQKVVWMHQLVVDFVKGIMDDSVLAIVEQAMIVGVEKLTETNNPMPLRNWQVHLRHLAKAARPRQDELAAGLYNALGDYLLIVGAYQESRDCLEWALAVREDLLGLEHPDIATTLNYLGYTHQLSGNWEKAKAYHQRALTINKQQLGLTHRNTARSYHFLGMFHGLRGEYKEAETFYNQALKINEEILPADHPHTAFTLNGLGLLCKDNGDLHQAVVYIKRSLSILEKALGHEHPDVATTLCNLGNIYQSLNDFEKAKDYIEQALTIVQKSLKADHPTIASVLKGLGSLHQTMGNTNNARTCFSQALTIYEDVFGKDHEKTKQLQMKLLKLGSRVKGMS